MDFLEWSEDMTRPVTDEELSDVDGILARFSDVNGYPIIPEDVWHRLNAVHRQVHIRRRLAWHLYRHKVPFPLTPPTLADAKEAFDHLLKMPWSWVIVRPTKAYLARVPYEHLKGVQAAALQSARHNAASNHFQWQNRIRCRGWRDPSPWDAWADLENLSRMRWTFWSLERQGPDSVGAWKRSFLQSTDGIYQAAQFRPSSAKGIYGWLGGSIVLDPSCGWGDRLAGAYATPTVTTYYGCDPNPDTYAGYQAQCVAYETWLGNRNPTITHLIVNGFPAFRCDGVKTVVVINAPFEDVPWDDVTPGGVDVVFTSPPYFCTERYAEKSGKEELQSWHRYPKPEAWRDDFYFKMMTTAAKLVRARDGIVAFNIADPILGVGKKKQRHLVCDASVDHMRSLGMTYAGVAGLELALRPSSNPDRAELQQGFFVEPIWLFTWGRELPVIPPSLAEAMFRGATPDDDAGMGEL